MSNNKIFDFYAENRESFYKKFTTESILVHGKYDAESEISIILTTYKRPELLKEALESAINQKGYNKYQILVVDNEGAPLETETETSMLMKKYDIDKVMYFRHKKATEHKTDSAVRLAKTKWFVCLHDDDMLSPYHLKVMSEIVSFYSEIKFLSGVRKNFLDGNEFEKDKIKKFKYQIIKQSKYANCLGFYVTWQGALINRKAYINIGGMPTISNHLGDYCMVQKFHNKYGVYELQGNYPLYYGRNWGGRASSGGTEIWTQLYKNEFNYHQYVSNYYHPITKKFWNRISLYRILEKAINTNTSNYKTQIDIEELSNEAQVGDDYFLKTELYRKDMAKKFIYECFMDKFTKKMFGGEVLINGT